MSTPRPSENAPARGKNPSSSRPEPWTAPSLGCEYPVHREGIGGHRTPVVVEIRARYRPEINPNAHSERGG